MFRGMTAFLVGLCLSSSAFAEDLVEILSLAKQHDARFRAAMHARNAEREALPQARAAFLPDLSYEYGLSKVEDSEAAGGKADNASGSLKLSQSIFDYGNVQGYRQARVSLQRFDVEYREAEQDLLIRTAEGYFNVLDSYEQLMTVSAEKAAMAGHLKLAERRLSTGLGRRVDVEDAKARYLESLAKEVEYRSAYLDSRYQLRELTGELPGPLSSLQDDLTLAPPEPADADDWVARALENNPAIQAGRFRVRERNLEVEKQKSGHFPSLALEFEDTRTDKDDNFGSRRLHDRTLALNLTVPLFDGFAVSSRVKQAVERKFQVMEEFTETARRVERETRDAYQRIIGAIAKIEALSQSAKAQQRTLQSKSTGYKVGRYSIIEVLDAEQALSNRQLDLTRARYEYVLNTLRLKASVGQLQETDLARVNSWLAAPANPAAGPAG